MSVFGVPIQALMGQLLIGLINGAFYAMLSLGLAVIFGLLNIINFTHGAQYMMGAFAAFLLLQRYWQSGLAAGSVPRQLRSAVKMKPRNKNSSANGATTRSKAAMASVVRPRLASVAPAGRAVPGAREAAADH